MSRPIDIDADPEDANWLRTIGFDLATPEGDVIETEEELARTLEDIGVSLEEFKKLPAWKGWLRHKEQIKQRSP